METSVVERKTQHLELCDKASNLNKILSGLFPSTSPDDSVGRLKLFSKIISDKKFEINNQDNQDYSTPIKSLGICS